MTPKEALLNLVTLMRDEYNFPFNLTTEYKVLKQALTELEELKRYLTSEEVCKEFSKSWGNPVRYDERHSLFEMYVGDNTWKPVELLRMRTEKPSIITLIGRFYEGMEKKDV